MQDCKVDILGTEYSIKFKEMKDEGSDGYCDYTSKEIVIRSDNTSDIGCFEWLQKRALRHEIVHAFMAESGLQSNWQHVEQFGHDETTVDWFAIQSPKIFLVYAELGLVETTNMSITYHGDDGSISVGTISADRVQIPAVVAKSAMI